MPDIEIVEVSPRDGLQNETRLISTEDKATLVRRCLDAGLRRIEVTAFARPDRVPQMADAEELLAAVRDDPRLRSIGLVLNRRGLDRAIAAGCDEVDRRGGGLRRTRAAQPGRSTPPGRSPPGGRSPPTRAPPGCATTVMIAAAFGCPFDGEVAPARVLDVARACLEAGPDEVAIADTIGVGVPAQVRELVGGLRELDATVPLRAHFHNTRNTGYANALAAIEAGVQRARRVGRRHRRLPLRPGRDRQHRHRGPRPTSWTARASPPGSTGESVAATGAWISDRLGLPQAPALLGRAGGFPA